MPNKHSRRSAIKNIVAGTAALGTAGIIPSNVFASQQKKTSALKGNINHSVCQWTYSFISVEELCKAVKDIGFNAIDLMGPKDWPTLQKYGIYSSMCYIAGEVSLTKGWNDKANHSNLIKEYTDIIPLMVSAGYKDVICFSGSRNGMDDWTGLDNCTEGLKQVMSLAEKNGITIHMELLNSKVDHKDYMCDKTKWGVELCKRIGSPNFKLLYDIYHMQIDESQELFYPAIMKAIIETGYKGYVAQEFIPAAQDKIASLRKAIQICDV